MVFVQLRGLGGQKSGVVTDDIFLNGAGGSPTLSTWGVMVAVLLFLGAGTIAIGQAGLGSGEHPLT